MKKYILTFLFLLLPTSIFAIAGFGLQVAQGQMKVEESVLGGADIPGVTLTKRVWYWSVFIYRHHTSN